MTAGGQAYWDHIYATKAANELSGFQERPAAQKVPRRALRNRRIGPG
jgi:hypothetical protein